MRLLVMPFVEDMIFKIIFIIILLLLLLFSCISIYILFFIDIFCLWKGIMKWWAPLLACAWDLLSKARNSKVGLRLRGASRSFEGGFTNSTLVKNAARPLG